jgi:hypothetical protein
MLFAGDRFLVYRSPRWLHMARRLLETPPDPRTINVHERRSLSSACQEKQLALEVRCTVGLTKQRREL